MKPMTLPKTLPKHLEDMIEGKGKKVEEPVIHSELQAALLLIDFEKFHDTSEEEIAKTKEQVIELARTDLIGAIQMALDWSKAKK